MDSNFCTTSVFFGGKFINFFETGDRLYNVMCQAEKAFGVQTFSIMDENFLLHRKRALELLDRMKEAGKALGHGRLASANALRLYKIEEPVEIDVSWIWVGLESPRSNYQAQGHRLATAHPRTPRTVHSRAGSTVIGLEQHMPDNIGEEIEYAVDHNSDFHHFAVYTPMTGTLHKEMFEQGCMLDSIDHADIHGQDGSTSATLPCPARIRSVSRLGLLPTMDRTPQDRRLTAGCYLRATHDP